tara:strand:- start:350 stop:661 length:312 start_codon:yes stop_codon:yes gene_type:complete
MAKKIVELKSTKRKVELKEMTIDEVDYCSDIATIHQDSNGGTFIRNMSQARTAWLRRGIKGGDFKPFKTDLNGLVEDKVIKQLNDDEKNELMNLIQEHQKLGE